MQKGLGEVFDNSFNQTKALQIADRFRKYLEKYYSLGIQQDEEIMADLYECYINAFNNPFSIPAKFNDLPIFRSSGVGGCPREHAVRLKGYNPDVDESATKSVNPRHTRWQNIGTKMGDMLQEDLLHAEKYMDTIYDNVTEFHFETVFKERIVPEYEMSYFGLMDKEKYVAPHFEQFSTVAKKIKHHGEEFILTGSVDGIMIYTNEFGEDLRVGLEIKSKQTSSSRTSLFSMKAPDPKHIEQVTAYSIMHEVDFWMIVYINTSKKSWEMTDEDYRKNPDLRVFGIFVTPDMRIELLSKLADITYRSKLDNNPPKLSLQGWNFNAYKEACAKDLSMEEVSELESEAITYNGQAWMKNSMQKAVQEILTIREEH